MKKFKIRKASLQGDITVPTSKSHTMRAILFGAMGKGKSVIHHYLPSADTSHMIEACRSMGATVVTSPNRLEISGINGKIQYTQDVINAGNSGIVLRFCAALGALAPLPIVITGDHSIRYLRPVKALMEGLTQLGVSTMSMRGDDLAPLIIKGPLKSGKATIDGQDSQPVSALLIAAAFAEGPIELHVRNPGEKPWVGLTLAWFDRLGIPYKNEGFKKYSMQGSYSYEGFEYTVPGDFSTAAFPIAAALVSQSELTLKNLDINDVQGDKELIFVLQKMGARIEIDEANKTLVVKKGSALQGISVDINNFVDALTTLAVIACFAEGETHIRNAAIAKDKECNRIHCIATELRKMGANIQETEDGLIIKKSLLKGSTLQSYNDHRMAMSLAVAALGAPTESIIESVECIEKTFPHFVRDFNRLGAQIEELS